jgi:prephenate dehydratase
LTGAIAFLGPAGTYSEQALKQYDSSAEPVPVRSERAAILAVAEGEVERALVPIENSLEGAVTATLDALAGETHPVTIVAEVVLPVSLCLIGPDQPLEAIETVISHPQPLGQCAGYLANNLPNAAQVAMASTAESVRTVAAEGGAQAAIGSRAAAELYELPVLVESIEDEPGNVTRFVVLAPTGTPPDSDSAPFKTSVVFQGAGDDSPGWLVRCLSELADRSINLTKIESRPWRGHLGHYLFVVDLEGSTADPSVGDAIEGLRTHCEEVRVLGSYPAAG